MRWEDEPHGDDWVDEFMAWSETTRLIKWVGWCVVACGVLLIVTSILRAAWP